MKKQQKLIEDEKNDLDINQELKEKTNEKDTIDEEFEIDSTADYRNLQTLITYEDEDYIHTCNLNNKIDEIFKSTRWAIISPSKKIPKDLIALIFQDILKELEETDYTMVEKFVAICDYTAINYQKAYESIHMKYKEIIVQEMDQKYGILSKKGIKKIF